MILLIDSIKIKQCGIHSMLAIYMVNDSELYKNVKRNPIHFYRAPGDVMSIL